MIAIGGTKITKAYLGSIELKNIAIGDELLLSSEPSPLPYDAEIEFLESTGTQYIQLSLSVSKTSYFEVGGTIIPLHPNNNTYGVFGANPDRQMRAEFYSYYSSTDKNTYASMVGGNPNNGGWTLKVGEKADFAISTTFVKDYNTTKELIRPLTDNITGFRIFAYYKNNSRYPVRFCEFYIKVDDTKVYDFIPVRVGTTGYMYDKVSKTLFGNAGTGNFVLGNDIT
jgi:hypothetical protein